MRMYLKLVCFDWHTKSLSNG